ncbi:MAG: hypothetical protein JXQ83_10825 [Candidatus Glassbacteria bacterium]|nr:hypothetical protein [Candidatus Glassbacteria bacterium]
MKRHRLLIFFALALLAFGLASPSAAEMMTSRESQGNNLGWTVATGWCMPWGRLAVPRGSTNYITDGGWTFGPYAAVDLDGDGSPGDTIGLEHIRDQMAPLCSIESYDLIMQWVNAGELNAKSGQIDYVRIWSSLDKEELDLWPVEGRIGRVASGAPNVSASGETMFFHSGDVFNGWGGPQVGFYMGWTLRFLDFGESNNICYGHIHMENVSEYQQYNSNSDYAAVGKANPNGYTWNGLLMMNGMRGISYNGENADTWALHPEKRIFCVYPTSPEIGAFTPPIAPLVGFKMINPPRNGTGEEMDLTVVCTHGEEEFGFSGTKQVFVGFTYGQGYRAAMNVPQGWYDGVISPFTGEELVGGWPGRIGPENSRWGQWVWGGNDTWQRFVCYGELHDIAPRDTIVFDFAYMFTPPGVSSYIRPDLDIANIDAPLMQEVLAPLENYAEIAEIVTNSGFALPSAPKTPQLTIIPGDREVTITWSDVNLQTPDSYYYFLEENGLNPNSYYQEYDFEGFRIYRSFVGPSDSHSELLADFNKTDNNLQFFYVDKLEDDKPYYRMANGLKVWYAVQAYDINYDPATNEAFSLPPAENTGGKTWNRPGNQLYSVIPRSEASNFRPASLLGVTYVGDATVDEHSVELAGDGNGKLTEAPKDLQPKLGITLEVLNNEKITQDLTIYMAGTSRIIVPGGTQCRFLDRAIEMKLLDSGKNDMGPAGTAIVNTWSDAEFQLMSTPDEDGINYVVNVLYEATDFSIREDLGNLHNQADPGTYTGGTLALIDAVKCNWGPQSAIGAMITSGQFEVTWKALGADMSVDVVNMTRGTTVPFGLYADEQVWGFMPDGTFGDFYDEIANGVSQADRSNLMLETIPADNTDGFILYLNGIAWQVSDITAMPAAGTKFTIINCYGSFNEDGTVFTQRADPLDVGDEWKIDIKASSINVEDADLSQIKVVPNPYVGSSFLDLSPANRRIEFINLPSSCTIRIYSLGGVLVNVLNHIGANRQGWGNYTDWDRLTKSEPNVYTGYDNHGGTEAWNLRNRFGQLVASGLYFYHVTDSRNETYTGRFYVIN